MHLLVIITRQEDKACDFLNLLPTVGVRGATVIEGRGMGKILRDHLYLDRTNSQRKY